MLDVLFHAASSADFSTLVGTSTDVIFNAPPSAAYYVPAVTALSTTVLIAFRDAFFSIHGFPNQLYFTSVFMKPCCLPEPSARALFEVLRPFLFGFGAFVTCIPSSHNFLCIACLHFVYFFV